MRVKIAKNTSKHWDSLWKGAAKQPANLVTLRQELNSVRWKRIKARARAHFGSLKNLPVVELGSGMGTYAALFASEGAKVTLVDYSPQALRLAKDFFTTLALKATFVQADIFNLKPSFQGKFAISTSCGVAEHFLGKRRTGMLDAHLAVLKPKGMTFIMVPNRNNLPYFTYKTIAEAGGFWPWGEEYPYTTTELVTYCQKKRIDNYGFFGDSFLWSLNYLNPFSLLGKKFPWFKRLNIPETIPTPLDERFSYSLGLWAVK